MSKDLIKKAWDLAEKEAQEKEVNRVKEIITAYLTKVDDQEKVVKKEQEKLSLLKKDIDDLKSGRLDKIEERQEKDSKARDISLIIVHRIEKEYVPMYPWRSPWVIEWNPVTYYPSYQGGYTTTCTNGNNAYTLIDYPTVNSSNSVNCFNSNSLMNSGISNGSNGITGVAFSNFVGGAYEINGKIINL